MWLGMADITDLISTALPAKDKNFAFQPESLCMTLSTTKLYCLLFEMAVNHQLSIMVVTKMRVGDDRVAKIIEGLPFDGSIVTDTV